MPKYSNGNRIAQSELSVFSRNNFFYGKLMDAHHFEMEQAYFINKRLLLNRLLQGWGVVCGLEVKPTRDGRNVQITPGVALDCSGRDIIVPSPSLPIDLRRLTDECCQPTGKQAQGSVILSIAYMECETEREPVMTGECETERDCVPSMICERYCCIVQEDSEIPAYPTCPLPGPLDFEDDEMSEQSYRSLVEWISQPCPTVNGQSCVPLAWIDLPEDPQEPITPEMCHSDIRPLVYSNTHLFELLLCLWERVEECCGSAPSSGSTQITGMMMQSRQGATEAMVAPNQLLRLDVASAFYAMDVFFNKPIDHSTITTFNPANNNPDDVSLLIERRDLNRPVTARIENLGPTATRLIIDEEPNVFTEGKYQVTLRGSTEEDRPAIKDTQGMILDGEPYQLPSGDGQAGGDFAFRFVVVPSAQLFVVTNMALIGPEDRHTMENLDGEDDLTEDSRFNVLQISFNKPVAFESVTTITNGDEEADEVSLLVRYSSDSVTGQAMRGIVEQADQFTIRFIAHEKYFVKGLYEVTLKGDTSGGSAIKNSDGLILDGDRDPDHPDRLPSGDGQVGGNLTFEFRIDPGLI